MAPLPLIPLAGAAISAGMGLINAKATKDNNEANRNHDRDMMRENAALNVSTGKQLTQFNKQQQLDLWEKTGYEAQRKQMEEAGLNAGLMYGMGGGGGQTASVATGGGAVGHSSTKGEAVQYNPLDMASIAQIMQATRTNEAQEELIKAQTDKTQVETGKIGGVDTEESKARTGEISARTGGIIQDVLEKKQSMGDRMSQIEENAKQEISQTEKARNEARISTETADAEISKTKSEAIGAAITNILLKSEVKVNEAQVKEIGARIEKMSADILQGWERLGLEERKTKIQMFAEEIKAQYPNVFNVTGNIIDEGVQQIYKIIENITGTQQKVQPRKVE